MLIRHVSRIFLHRQFSSASAETFLFAYPHFSGCIRLLRTRYASPMTNDKDLALHQRVFAQEQTLMDWIRTCASFITFGFAFYKFFEYLNEGDETSRRILCSVPPNLHWLLLPLVSSRLQSPSSITGAVSLHCKRNREKLTDHWRVQSQILSWLSVGVFSLSCCFVNETALPVALPLL